jgi:hypothetical protein
LVIYALNFTNTLVTAGNRRFAMYKNGQLYKSEPFDSDTLSVVWPNIIWEDTDELKFAIEFITPLAAMLIKGSDNTYTYPNEVYAYLYYGGSPVVKIENVNIPNWLTLSIISCDSIHLNGYPPAPGSYPISFDAVNNYGTTHYSDTIVVN